MILMEKIIRGNTDKYQVHLLENKVSRKTINIFSNKLDKFGVRWFNINTMRQVNRNSNSDWWWPAG